MGVFSLQLGKTWRSCFQALQNGADLNSSHGNVKTKKVTLKDFLTHHPSLDLTWILGVLLISVSFHSYSAKIVFDANALQTRYLHFFMESSRFECIWPKKTPKSWLMVGQYSKAGIVAVTVRAVRSGLREILMRTLRIILSLHDAHRKHNASKDSFLLHSRKCLRWQKMYLFKAY